MTQQRAPKGGTTAINGEFYHGGEFLPTTELPSQSRPKAAAKARKQNYAPYKWDYAPEGQRAIYAQLQGAMLYDRATDTFSIYAPYYSQQSAESQRWFDERIARYNRGDRWMNTDA